MRTQRTVHAWLVGGVSSLALAGAAAAAPDDQPQAPAPGTVEGVVVTAPREEVKARQAQFAAPNLINVQSAETIAKYPDFNAAEALARIPGVTLSSDTGEGRFVEIRGIDGNLNGATYGGVVLLNTNPGGTQFSTGRAVEFDTIPTGAIDGLIVTKTLSPDHEAEGLGGSVELTPRTALNTARPFLDLTAGTGYEFGHDHYGPTNGEIAVGGRFGFANGRPVVHGWGEEPVAPGGFFSNPTPFSFVLTASSRTDRRGFDDIEEDYIDDPTVAPDKAYSDLQLRRYDYHRRRYGYGAEFDFQPNDDHSWYLRASLAGYTESAVKNRLTYDSLDGSPAIDPSNPKGFTALSDLSVKGTDEQESHRNQVYAFGGQDRFGDLLIDYRAAYSRATFVVGYNYGTTFTGPTDVAVAYDNVTDPDHPKISILDGTNVNDASLYKLKKSTISNNTEQDADEERSYALNARYALHWLGDDAVKFGVQARIRDKTATPYTESITVAPTNLSAVSSAPDLQFYDGLYTNGPMIAHNQVRALTNAPGAISSGSEADLTGYFNAQENIYAGYGMYTANVGPWGLLAGVRVEHTQAKYSSYSFDQDGNPLGLDRRSSNYTDVFPTLQVRYTIAPKLLLRATYSTGIGRPGFSQVAGATTIDYDNGIITTSNPNLKPTTGNNFDLSLEYYLPFGGIAQVGLFDKEFENYIVARVRNGTDPRLPDVSSVEFDTFENVSAFARGIEAAYNQRFAWLPKPFDGLGVEANLTLVDSEVALRDGESDLLPATSRVTGNVAAFYEAHGVQVRVAGQYVSHSLFGIGDTKALNVIQDDRFTLDLTTSYQLTHAVSLYFNAKNLTDEPLRYYEGAADRPIQREFYDVTLEGGLRAKF